MSLGKDAEAYNDTISIIVQDPATKYILPPCPDGFVTLTKDDVVGLDKPVCGWQIHVNSLPPSEARAGPLAPLPRHRAAVRAGSSAPPCFAAPLSQSSPHRAPPHLCEEPVHRCSGPFANLVADRHVRFSPLRPPGR